MTTDSFLNFRSQAPGLGTTSPKLCFDALRSFWLAFWCREAELPECAFPSWSLGTREGAGDGITVAIQFQTENQSL